MRTAGRGGIDSITELPSADGSLDVVIEGRLLDPPGRRATWAPNYNLEAFWNQWRAEFDLKGWHPAHLWGQASATRPRRA